MRTLVRLCAELATTIDRSSVSPGNGWLHNSPLRTSLDVYLRTIPPPRTDNTASGGSEIPEACRDIETAVATRTVYVQLATLPLVVQVPALSIDTGCAISTAK